MTRLFVDASALMEIMMERSKLEQVVKIFHDPAYELFPSTLTVHILYYFAEVTGIERGYVRKLVALTDNLPVTTDMIGLAQQRYTGKDFEDCLQAACAELSGCQEILSLDKKFQRHSGTPLKMLMI